MMFEGFWGRGGVERGQGIVSVRNSGQYCPFRVSHFTLNTGPHYLNTTMMNLCRYVLSIFKFEYDEHNNIMFLIEMLLLLYQ